MSAQMMRAAAILLALPALAMPVPDDLESVVTRMAQIGRVGRLKRSEAAAPVRP